MPITFSPPLGGVIGSGQYVSPISDFIGPLDSGTHWTFQIFPHGGEDIVLGETVFDNRSFTHTTLGKPESGGVKLQNVPQVSVADGDLVDMTVSLTSGTGTELDATSVTSLKWTGTSDWNLIANLPQSAGGLTDAESAQLADVHNLVAPPFTTTAGAPLPIDVGDLVVRPALKLLGIDTTVHTLSGSGTLDLPSILGFNTAWGLVLDVTSAPSGWGRKPGYVDSFNFRIGQFLYLVPSANGEGAMVIEEFRLHLEHFTWVFRESWGSAIAYYIDPPCEVQLRFLTAFTP